MNTLLELDSFDATLEALSIVYDIKRSDSENFKSFVYEGYLIGSGADPDIVVEGALDMFKKIADGIKKIMEKIKAFFKKILLYITSGSEDLDKLAAQVKPHISDKDIDFKIRGYKFTVLEKSGPNTSEFEKIVSDYNSDIEKLSKLKNGDFKDQIFEWLKEDNLDKLRGEVLGYGQSIPDDEFTDTIRKYYRNDEESTSEIEVDKTYVNGILSHAEKIEKTKKEAIRDRDKLLTLLSKTESFFSDTLPKIYRGKNTQVNAARIDISDRKFSSTNNYIDASNTDIIAAYASMKSKQVNKIAGMINLVACERVNALKDQIKQERIILRKCLFGETKETSTSESLTVFPDYGYMGRSYASYALESDIQSYKYYDELSKISLLTEAEFLIESIKGHETIWLFEADMDSRMGKVKQVISDIIETVVKAFRQKAIGEAQRYKPWLAEIKDGLADKAKNKKDFKMANFADADYAGMANSIIGAIRKAYTNRDFSNYGYAKDIVSNLDSLEKINDDSSKNILINYFRTGATDGKLDTVTLNGADLSNKVSAMVKYIDQYGTSVTKPSENISSTFKNLSDGFTVTESVTGSTYLDLISRPICESEVIACENYNSIFGPITGSKRTVVTEAGETNVGTANAGLSDANKSNAANQTASGNEGAKDSNAQNNELKSATQVSSEDKTEAEGGNKKTNNAAVEYKKNTDRFFKNVITLYIKAREEQFLAYVNALSEIDGTRPKFDKNGKYISKNAAKEQKEENEEVVKAG